MQNKNFLLGSFIWFDAAFTIHDSLSNDWGSRFYYDDDDALNAPMPLWLRDAISIPSIKKKKKRSVRSPSSIVTWSKSAGKQKVYFDKNKGRKSYGSRCVICLPPDNNKRPGNLFDTMRDNYSKKFCFLWPTVAVFARNNQSVKDVNQLSSLVMHRSVGRPWFSLSSLCR